MIAETKLALLLITIGAQNLTTQQLTLDKLQTLVERSVLQSDQCQQKPKVFDFLVTDQDKIIVDFDLAGSLEGSDCEQGKQFCRAVYSSDETLEQVNCR